MLVLRRPKQDKFDSFVPIDIRVVTWRDLEKVPCTDARFDTGVYHADDKLSGYALSCMSHRAGGGRA